MKRAFLGIVLFAGCVASHLAGAAPPALTLQPYVSGLASPVEIVNAGDHTGRLFIVEQAGRIRVVRNHALLPTAFLDLRSSVGGPVLGGGEQGLLGLAFHPNYEELGFFYVFYTRVRPGDASGNNITVARYTRSSLDPDRADPASGLVMLDVPHPSAGNHNAGKLAFGRDGYLYVAIGDGGTGGAPAQQLTDLRGKILRLDVDAAFPYAIPPSNPFAASGDPGIRKEIWSYGLRNPFRFSFDRANGDLFIGDVGQNLWEEINFEPFTATAGGRNYGWPTYEGMHCFSPPTGCSLAGHVPPILEYPHDGTGGFSVTGGYRYRGSALPALSGFYVYGDFVSGRIWAAEPGGGGSWTTTQVATSSSLSAFGEDENGELFVANHGGSVSRITPPATSIPRLANIATRGHVSTGMNVLIAGFIIGGTEAKTVVVNVAGPSLASSGITNPLANPRLTLVRQSDHVVMGSNDDWGSAPNAAQIQASGLQPNHPSESAVLVTLAPGAYTVVAEGVGGTTGVGLIGVFEVDYPQVPLVNISTRGQVLTNEEVMIAGFIIQGNGPRTVVINVAGPSLTTFGIETPLANPTVTLVRSSDNVVMGTNDNWQVQAVPGDVAAIQATGFQPNHPNEPALIVTLPPGGYTAIVRGAGNTTGVGLVGVFLVP